PDRVTLHAARVCRCVEQTLAVAAGGADAPERPRPLRLDEVAATLEPDERLAAEALLDLDDPRPRLPRVERLREVVGVEVRRVDRLLGVQAEVDDREEEDERPLVLVVAARRAEGEQLAVAAR